MQLSKSEEQVMQYLWKRKKAFMKDILALYEEEITDMLIKLKYETNKDWINEIK